jgi:hypothetical protein
MRSTSESIVSFAVLLLLTELVRGDVAITELMVNPGGDDTLWEWIEVRNTTASVLNLDGWVFDDDDGPDVLIHEDRPFNISSLNGNTTVPAGGVAVLYPGDALNFTPQRLLDAWQVDITLIAVDDFGNGLANTGDAIGLWQTYDDYLLDTLPGTTSPRRMFTHAKASIDYAPANNFPTIANGRSITWNGEGSANDGANWVVSEVGELSAFASEETQFESTQINSSLDLGNPGTVPAGSANSGVLITEIMFNPASPEATEFSEADFEWIEIFNNSGAPIDFGSTSYVLDDNDGNQLGGANIVSGSLGSGATGILFNDADVTAAEMQTMWGSHNFIPVSNWSTVDNSGDTIAIWASIDDYNNEAETDGPNRTHDNALVALTFDTLAGQGWPTSNGESSIYLESLSADPNAGASWARSALDDGLGSRRASGMFRSGIDHPGGDVGSPGIAPAVIAIALPGDYNQNGVVDAADYVVWRENEGLPITLPNDTTPGEVNEFDFETWRTNFGHTAASADLRIAAMVPEPDPLKLLAVALIGTLPAVRRSVPLPFRSHRQSAAIVTSSSLTASICRAVS